METEAAFVKDLLTSDIENMIVDVRLISTVEENSATHSFVEALKKMGILFVYEI